MRFSAVFDHSAKPMAPKRTHLQQKLFNFELKLKK